MLINIQNDIMRFHNADLLTLLLIDKTTKRNIIWATGAYKELGKEYRQECEITPQLITLNNMRVIKTRARKALEEQTDRTRQMAEVFTPFWVCRMMNDYADEMWFGQKDVFHKDGKPTERVIFPEGKTWKDYVKSKRLEITCGEAPYLVSRYDASTGEIIPVNERIGILDRKLRVVNENTETREEWYEWALTAMRSSYGYEFQGDNLLIARINFIATFEDYLRERWNENPTNREYRKIMNITAWNLWQMDGLTDTIPYCIPDDNRGEQISLFDIECDSDDDKKQPYCKIFDWTREHSIAFNKLKKGDKVYEV